MIQAENHPGNPEWAHAQILGLPSRWQKRLFNKWQQTRAELRKDDAATDSDANRAAAHWLTDIVGDLKTVNLPLDASDAQICERGEVMAAHCNSLAGVFHEIGALRGAMAHVCASNHITAPEGKKMTDSGAVARMVCHLWWRKQLRKLHAKAVEGGAISIGYVNKTRDIYVSNESLERRRQQIRRNVAMLENTKARNENGDEYTLAQLAATSTANKAIRRGELMTRIAGFERIAIDMRHVGLFFTMTCPSRMHKWRTVKSGQVIENRRYDGTTPTQAQKYLSKTWARIRAKLARIGFKWYGFRIAEPNHDGTPHWHLLVFFAQQWPERDDIECAALPRVAAIVRRYALMDSGSETGAKKHRVDFKVMNPAKGTAAGYIAKYVSKNIDGYKVDKDLFGNEMLSTAQRVEAWAATWGIRQFQQIGGAPVTPWRELRRVKALPDDAPAHLIQAHDACNKTQTDDETKPAAWDAYVRAQGGVFIGRDYRIRLALEDTDGTGRYGEPLAARPIGIETSSAIVERDGIIPNAKVRIVSWLVKSVRHVWEIIRAGAGTTDRAIGAAWTRVNNCTQTLPHWAAGVDFNTAHQVNEEEKRRTEWDFSRCYDEGGRLTQGRAAA